MRALIRYGSFKARVYDQVEEIVGPFPARRAFEVGDLGTLAAVDGAAATEVFECCRFSEHMFYCNEGKCSCPGGYIKYLGIWREYGLCQ